MNSITVTPDRLVVEPLGLDKLWSLRNRIDVPVAHVRGATIDPGVSAEPKGVRAPGLAMPGKWAGTFHRDGERVFWNVSSPDPTIVIELTGEHFDRLVLSVERPREIVDAVNAAVSAADAGAEGGGAA
ncbi:hypothetical protein ACWKWP_04480 [Agromyces soli]